MHQPVMVDEVVRYLVTRTDGVYVDCTVGGGGHARRILLNAPAGRLLGIDLDPSALEEAGRTLGSFAGRCELVHGNFGDLDVLAPEHGVDSADGVLFDLGFSSLQLDDPRRGFSYSTTGPIDMRLDPGEGTPASALISRMRERDLSRLLAEYGEERRSHPIARAIIEARDHGRLETTADLAAAVAATKPQQRTKTLSRVFQAIRIAVNDELRNLRSGLEAATRLLSPGGRLVAISYHSLEDRIVKRAFATAEHPCTCPRDLPECVCGKKPTLRILTRHVVRPGDAEVARNQRARSAKLRAAERLAPGEEP
jgi:16S rRNA (cytosine1402-N4)-methyltransferase